jgi:hypothetical protein
VDVVIAAFVGAALRAGGWLKALATSEAARPFLIAIVACLALWGVHRLGVNAGVAQETAAEEARIAKVRPVVAKVETGGKAIAAEAQTHHEQRQVDIRWRTQILKEEVPVYVPQAVDRGFPLPDGLVRLHDAAAVGAKLPAAPDRPVETASDVTASQLGDAFVDNYATCYVWQSEALAWREWYPRQAELWKANIRAMSPSP